MKKDLIVVAFPTLEQSRWFYEENIKPLISFLNEKDRYTFESDTYILQLHSLRNPDKMRGLRAETIFISWECDLKIYNQIILPIASFDHSKVKVVM